MLASQAAVALDNAQWSQGLEAKVAERTAELSASNIKLEEDARPSNRHGRGDFKRSSIRFAPMRRRCSIPSCATACSVSVRSAYFANLLTFDCEHAALELRSRNPVSKPQFLAELMRQPLPDEPRTGTQLSGRVLARDHRLSILSERTHGTDPEYARLGARLPDAGGGYSHGDCFASGITSDLRGHRWLRYQPGIRLKRARKQMLNDLSRARRSSRSATCVSSTRRSKALERHRRRTAEILKVISHRRPTSLPVFDAVAERARSALPCGNESRVAR